MEELEARSLQKNEQGVALLFTLIILALLLVMALGFALSSMFDQKAAFNAANAASARILAQAQVKEIQSLIENNEANLDNSELYSHDSGSPAVTDTKVLKDLLASRLPVPVLLDTVDTDKVNWNYIRSKDSEQRIIGRTAFVVIAEGIALDALVDGRAAGSPYPKHNEINNTETRIGKYVSEINVRAPAPSVSNAIADALNWAEDKPVSGAGFTNGKYTGNWQSFDNLVSTLETAISGTLDATQKEELRKNVSLIVAKDEEAFWADMNGDVTVSSNELYKRFNLNRADWDTLNIDGKILLDSASTGAPAQEMEKWADVDSDAGSAGLPWLACFGYKDDGAGNGISDESLKGTFSLVLDRRRQIAANLKDYCDTDDTPTSDVDPATWYTGTSAAPAFTGNEKTPYINKAGVKVIASSFSTGSTEYNTSAKVEIKPLVGLINIYGANCSDDLKVRVIGSVTVVCKIAGTDRILYDDASNPFPTSGSDYVISFDTVIDVNGTGNASPNWPGGDGYSHFLEGTATAGTTLSVGPNAAAVNVEITVKTASIDKVILYDGTTNSKGYDYVKGLSVADLPFQALSSSTGADDSKTSWYGLEVNDPRQNLNSGDWVQYSPSSVNIRQVFSLDASDDTVCKPNAANSNIPAGGSPLRVPPNEAVDYLLSDGTSGTDGLADKDLEPVDTSTADRALDPANCNISTAYIRNAPMESPWELGFIHRAKVWQTINLKTYDINKAYQVSKIPAATGKDYILGGGVYSSGDANILDQIKMTEKAKSPRKINLRTQKSGTLEALFSKIKLKATIDASMSVSSMAGSSDAEMLAGVSTIITNIEDKFTNDTTYLPDTKRTRASIVDKLLLPLGATITATTDAEQEELIGKIINLTKVGGQVDCFTAVVIAQTIKDIGTSAGMPVSKASEDSTVKSRTCKSSVFDADIDLTNPEKSVYFDEITAEQKIIVKGYRAMDNSVKITSFQYVE